MFAARTPQSSNVDADQDKLSRSGVAPRAGDRYFALNLPLGYADPTGLYQQGHPLQGGSTKLDSFLRGAVNQALTPNRFPSTTFGGFVGAGLGTSILSNGLGSGARPPSVGTIASYQAAAPRVTGSRVSPAPSAPLPSQPTGFFQGVVNQATPYLPWRQAPLASTFGKFALDLNARNADGLVAGARATKAHVSDVFASNSIGEAAQKHVAFSLGNGSQSMLSQHPQTQYFAQVYGSIGHWLNTESATRGEMAAPFTDFVATAAIGGVAAWERPAIRPSLGYGRTTAMSANVEFQSYSNRGAFTTPGQAHHLNQTEILGGTVSYDAGVTTPLPGRAFADPRTPHFTAHRGTEAFFDTYRPGTTQGAKYPISAGPLVGNAPTFSQYNRALYNSLQEAGVPSREALRMVIEAKTEQLGIGLRGSNTLLNTPRRMGQAGGP